MDSSEIEVVPLDSNPTESPAITDVFSASAYGDLNHLKRFVEQKGSSVSLPDANGYYPLQWAALNNFPHVAQYIIEVRFCLSLVTILLLRSDLIIFLCSTVVMLMQRIIYSRHRCIGQLLRALLMLQTFYCNMELELKPLI